MASLRGKFAAELLRGGAVPRAAGTCEQGQ